MSLAPRVIDARGLACPQPVILTRKALAEGGPGRILVIVDSPASRENVVRFATHAGCAVERVEESGDEARILIRPSGTEPVLRVMVEAGEADIAEALAHRLVNSIQPALTR